MDDKKWATASLVISSTSRTAKDIGQALQLAATRQYEKGSICSPRNPKSTRFKNAVWILDSGLDDTKKPLEEHIKVLMRYVEARADAIRELARVSTIELCCGFSSENGQGGFCLKHKLLERLASFPVNLVMDLYPPEGNAR